MSRKIILIAVTLLLSLSFVGISFAEPKGNDRKGKYTYRKVYKACMQRGEIDSPRPLISPDAKTMAQWERVFEKKDFGQFGCQKEWQELEGKDVEDIFTYLYKHAADSPTPAKCK